jgi:hypothetical protein
LQVARLQAGIAEAQSAARIASDEAAASALEHAGAAASLTSGKPVAGQGAGAAARKPPVPASGAAHKTELEKLRNGKSAKLQLESPVSHAPFSGSMQS